MYVGVNTLMSKCGRLLLLQIAAKINQPGAGDAQPQGIKRPFEDEAHFGNLAFFPRPITSIHGPFLSPLYRQAIPMIKIKH